MLILKILSSLTLLSTSLVGQLGDIRGRDASLRFRARAIVFLAFIAAAISIVLASCDHANQQRAAADEQHWRTGIDSKLDTLQVPETSALGILHNGLATALVTQEVVTLVDRHRVSVPLSFDYRYAGESFHVTLLNPDIDGAIGPDRNPYAVVGREGWGDGYLYVVDGSTTIGAALDDGSGAAFVENDACDSVETCLDWICAALLERRP